MPPLTKIAPTHVRPPSKNLRPQKNLRAVNSTNVQFRNHQQCEKKILRDPFGAAKMTFRCFVLNLFRKIRGLGTFCAPQFNRGHVPPCLKVSVPAPPACPPLYGKSAGILVRTHHNKHLLREVESCSCYDLDWSSGSGQKIMLTF